MTKLTFAAATALAMAFVPVIAVPAFAQSLTPSSVVAKDHSMRASKLIGMDVFNQNGDKIGTIADIMIRSGKSEPMAVVSVGDYTGGGDKMIAMPMSHISLKSDKVMAPMTKPQLIAMPGWTFSGLNGGGG